MCKTAAPDGRKADGDGLLIPGNLLKPNPWFWHGLFGRANRLRVFSGLPTLSYLCFWSPELLMVLYLLIKRIWRIDGEQDEKVLLTSTQG